MKLYTVVHVVYNLRMCMKKGSPGQKTCQGRSFKGELYVWDRGISYDLTQSSSFLCLSFIKLYVYVFSTT